MEEHDRAAGAEQRRDLVKYPFPLDDGRLAYLWLPNPLASDEAERLCKMVRSLWMEMRSD